VGALAAGAIVLVRFPFSDLSHAKPRPAVVLPDAGRGDFILCQVTSNPYGDPGAVELEDASFSSGSLRVTSYPRPAKLFTANHGLITSQVGTLTPGARQSIARAVSAILELGRVP
jgi:mRNA interferase MazF